MNSSFVIILNTFAFYLVDLFFQEIQSAILYEGNYIEVLRGYVPMLTWVLIMLYGTDPDEVDLAGISLAHEEKTVPPRLQHDDPIIDRVYRLHFELNQRGGGRNPNFVIIFTRGVTQLHRSLRFGYDFSDESSYETVDDDSDDDMIDD